MVREAAPAVDRRDVHDRTAAPLLDERGGCRAAPPHRAAEVHVQDATDGVDVGAMERPPRADARVVDPSRERRELLRARGAVQVRRPFRDVPADDRAAVRDDGFDLRCELLVDLDADDEPAVGEQAVEAGAADPLPRAGDDNASIHRGSLVWCGQPGSYASGTSRPSPASSAPGSDAGIEPARGHGRGCSDLREMARRRVVALDRLQRRVDRAADLLISPHGAERPEAAADLGGRHVDRIPSGSHRDLLAGTDGIDDGDRPHQAVRVRMQRPVEQHLAGAGLHDAPPVHDRHSRAEKSDHREIVRDEEVRKVVLPLEPAQEIQHLSLDRDVERRDRLVEHDEARLGRERARHRDALTLPAGHLRWTATKELGAESDELEQLDHARPPGAPIPDPVHDEGGGDDPGDGAPAVERARRILEHGGQRPPYRPHLVASKPGQGTPLELDRPAVDLRQAEDGMGDRRLARARLADQAERLTGADGERDPVDGPDDGAAPPALKCF